MEASPLPALTLMQRLPKDESPYAGIGRGAAKGDPGASPRFAMSLFAAALLVIAWSAWAPVHRGDWLLENLLVAVALPLIANGYRRLRFSVLSYGALFLFLCLHEIGAHYTYSLVPYADWIGAAMQQPPHGIAGAGRNHFDRVLHAAYGFLVMPATLELFARRAPSQAPWRWIFPVTFVMAHSTIYELLEWAAAVTFGGNLGQIYLGTQGDAWDAQKDMLMASVGSLAAIILLSVLRWGPLSPRPAGSR